VKKEKMMNYTKNKKNFNRVCATALTTLTLLTPMSNVATAFAQDTPEIEVTEKKKTQKRNVMYYGDWSIWGGQGNFYPKDIPADQLTHLNFAFMDFDSEGNLVFTDEGAAVDAQVHPEGGWNRPNAGVLMALQDLRAQNPNMKLGISVGGWSKSGDFSEVASNPTKRAKLVNNLMKFVEMTSMDFVDIDWEFPGEVRQPDKVDNKNDEGTPNAKPEDKENYILLLQDLREALDKQGTELKKDYELSVALPAPKSKTDVGIDVDRLFKVVDFANVMTYDMHGAWDSQTGHQTGLYANPNEPDNDNNLSVDESVRYLQDNGAPSEKIVIGAAYYTRGWEKATGQGTDSQNPGLFADAAIATKDKDGTDSRGAANEAPLGDGDAGRMSGLWSYRSIDKLKQTYPGLKEYWDDAAKAPYLYDENSGAFFTYDNVRSVQEKANYVNQNDLGGVIGWMASQDKTTTSTKRDELTKTTKEGLFGSAKLPEHEITYSALDVSAKLSATTVDSGGKGIQVTITNNEKANESDAVLKSVEKGAETVKLPKLYIKGTVDFSKGDWLAGTVTHENGYTVVDLSSSYDSQFLEPGQSYTFKLGGEGEIKSIGLTQKIYKSGAEVGNQVIFGEDPNFGSGNGGGEVTPPENAKPTISGANAKTIKVGDNFDKLAGVTASDKEDGDLTSSLKVEGNVDTSKAGKNELIYSVKDSEGQETKVTRTITVKEANAEDAADEMVNPVEDVMVGYWHNWASKNDGYKQGTAVAMDLDEIHEDYNVVDVSFMKADASSHIPTFKPYEGTDSEFRKQVGELNEQGRAVLLALGGADAHIELTKADEDAFVAEIINQVEKYGFDGIDIDLEQSAITAAENQTVIPSALKKVKDHFAKEGKNFLITMAPEFPYLKANGAYAPYITGLEGYYDWINPQFYNQGGDGISGENGQWLAQNNDEKKEDFLYYLTKALLTGTDGYSSYVQIPADKFVIGLPSNNDAAATGYVKNPAAVQGALNRLKADNLGIKGLMTWSVNWDNGSDSSGKTYEWEFVNRYADMLDLDGDGEVTPSENAKPTFTGVDDATVEFGENFNPLAGVKANDEEDGDLTDKIQVRGTVNTQESGKHTLIYSVTDSEGATTTVTRKVTVKDAPVVEEEGKPEFLGLDNKVIAFGAAFDALEGVSASDKEDGDLTGAIKVEGQVESSKAGQYTLIYSVADSDGNETKATRIITVEANSKPVFTGIQDETLVIGADFDKLAGVKAVDKEDGDLTSKIKVEGDVDTSKVGKTTLTYTVTDSAGETVTVTRQVEVIEKAEHPAWDAKTTYLGGEIVSHKGKTYQAKWWTLNQAPDQNTGSVGAWEEILDMTNPENLEWKADRTYNAGDQVTHNGETYEAKWWTMGNEPGTEEYGPWKKVSSSDTQKSFTSSVVEWFKNLF
jgi:chitinase/chitodextrinase